MGFKELRINNYYDNDEYDLIKSFYNPIIRKAKIYKRASGFFSSSSFWSFIDGLKDFLDNEDSKIMLIISPKLSEEDIKAIIIGEQAREKVIENYLRRELIEKNKFDNQYNLLSWLVYTKKLEIKIVIKKDLNRNGIFHDKFGIIEDHFNNIIAFHGSMNESVSGIVENFEAIEVFKGWEIGDVSRVERIYDTFDRLWNDKTKKWKTISLPEGIKKEIINYRRKTINKNKPQIPNKYKLRDYQEVAISSWFKNKCSGILEMATGSGKTLTAIFAMIKLINLIEKKGFPCGIVIVVPYKNLLEQWYQELEEFNIKAIRCYEDKNSWKNLLRQKIVDFNKYGLENLYIITTNSTFVSEEFQKQINNIHRDYIFCADEVHHLGAPKILKLLNENVKFRLGLTATLGNEFENERVNRLKQYFGDVIFKFGLKEAIESNCLTRYYYFPIFIELTDNEMEEYLNLTVKISRAINIDDKSELLTTLLNKRKRIVFNANNKIEKFKEMVLTLKKYKKSLVYCGDKIESGSKFIDKINKIIYDSGIKTNTYTSKLNIRERKNILKNFEHGDIDVLTAIRCLDEGVNIPSLDCAFLLSSNNDSKQFIQRRGRILRKYEGKEFAYIYDFVVVPSLDKERLEMIDYDIKKVQAKVVRNELKRVKEFAELCENRLEVLVEISQILELYT